MGGILAVWNDCAIGREAAYENWYQKEHLIERVSVSGFLVGRRYEAVAAKLQFLTTYEVKHLEVLNSAEYRERLAHPTEQTIAIMRDGFLNMNRNVCERRAIRGAFRGGVVLTVAVTEAHPFARLQGVADGWPLSTELVHSEIWIATEKKAAKVSAEEALRGRDAKISGCLALEFLRREPALRVANELGPALPGSEVGVYQLMCTLRGEDIISLEEGNVA
jgi:hypothetical protein